MISESQRKDSFLPAKWRICASDNTHSSHPAFAEVMRRTAPHLRSSIPLPHLLFHRLPVRIAESYRITSLPPCVLVHNKLVSSVRVKNSDVGELQGLCVKTDLARASRGCRTSPAPEAPGPQSSLRWCRCG